MTSRNHSNQVTGAQRISVSIGAHGTPKHPPRTSTNAATGIAPTASTRIVPVAPAGTDTNGQFPNRVMTAARTKPLSHEHPRDQHQRHHDPGEQQTGTHLPEEPPPEPGGNADQRSDGDSRQPGRRTAGDRGSRDQNRTSNNSDMRTITGTLLQSAPGAAVQAGP
nr:hypothetical protein Ade03nite_33240 [Actinoplanes derwentensis]